MSSLLFGLSLFLLVWISHSVGQCPESWTNFQGSCYKIIENKETWLEANEYCQLFDGYLVELTTKAEIDFARREYRNRNLDNGVWIGLSDIINEGEWRWTKKRTVATETDWASTEPGNRKEEDCAEIWTDFLWHDDVCNNPHYYMCEMSDSSPVIG